MYELYVHTHTITTLRHDSMRRVETALGCDHKTCLLRNGETAESNNTTT